MRLFLFYLSNLLLLLIVLSLNRFSLFVRYKPEDIYPHYSNDLWAAFLRGFRFDLKIASFLLLPLLIVAILSFFREKKQLEKLSYSLSLFLWSVTLTLIMVDHQYYSFFQSHINVLIFGLAEDDTSAVLKSMWTDHPVIKWMLIVGLAFFSIKHLNKLTLKKIPQISISLKKKILLILFYIPIHVLFMRGSITSPFPLQRDDAFVSNHPFINYLVINPHFALKEAIKDKKNTSQYLPEDKILSKYNFNNEKEALASLGFNEWEDLYSLSPKNTNLEKKPPNVVYVMMESWSGFLFDYHSSENNLLSTFEKHTKEDFVFPNVISAASSTLPSIEAMLTGKEVKDLFIWNSPFRFNSFPSSIAKTYQDKGYRTVFITSGKMGWRNLNQWVSKQGFDELYGQNDIKALYPDAEECAWGVFDEYSFKLAEDLLLKEKNKALFIYVMTTSNHTPYEIPSHYTPGPTKIPDELNPALTTSLELAEKSLVGYQYSNFALGNFLTNLKSTSLKDNTVVTAVGDHSSWMLAPRNSDVIPLNKSLSVPLYFYLPPSIREKTRFYKNRAASHKDITSTLIPLTLSEAKYFNLGNNLFYPHEQKNTFFGLYSDSTPHRIVLTEKDQPEIMNQKARGYLTLNHIYFQREICKMLNSWCQ